MRAEGARKLGSMASHVRPRLVVIAGPTGVGKTAVAVALARLLPIEVISADSRQVYRGMDAATGKPTAEERAAVAHHLIDIVDPDDRYQAARFRCDAAALVERIRARGAVPVVVGGTGLYIRALVRGLDAAPIRSSAANCPPSRPGKGDRRSGSGSTAWRRRSRRASTRTTRCG